MTNSRPNFPLPINDQIIRKSKIVKGPVSNQKKLAMQLYAAQPLNKTRSKRNHYGSLMSNNHASYIAASGSQVNPVMMKTSPRIFDPSLPKRLQDNPLAVKLSENSKDLSKKRKLTIHDLQLSSTTIPTHNID